jgi:Flp pilus assembly protein TadG
VTEGKGVCAVRHFRRAGQDEGAAAVEFALLFPIFMILALGLINGGLAFSRQINVTQAAREASRFGATYSVTAAGDLATWLTAVDNATCQAAGNGDACGGPNTGNPIAGYDYRCVALIARLADGTIDAANTGWKETYSNNVNGNATTTTLPPNATTGCPSVATPDLGPNSKVVQVVLSRGVQFFVLFINPKLHLDAVSTTPYEGDLPP